MTFRTLRAAATRLVPALVAALLASSAAHAQGYSMADLDALVTRREYAEAVARLKDVAPTQRSAAWDALAVKAIVGVSEAMRSDCERAYELVKELRAQFGSVATNPVLLARQVEFGVCHLKEMRSFADRRGREQMIGEVLALSPAAIVPLYGEARHVAGEERALQWIAADPDAVRANARLKTTLLERAGAAGVAPARRADIVATLKRLGWYDDWVRGATARLDELGAAFMRGNFGASTGESVAEALREAGHPNDLPVARVYVPLGLRLAPVRARARLDRVAALSPAALRQAEREMIDARPEHAFWFEGDEWEGAPWAEVRRLFPVLASTAIAECEAFRRDPARQPVHVWRSSCRWIVPGG
ncbi:hypothetical protein [Piscinibacter koreensis]|uniref:Uncharacterized protein n=1 Tax=Piscinibacter koreensis TaxID=2742824 RepID=A0A7Y6NMD7_9BURK|nr:hypothetical protein [Schlegelella koreensis]NUZ05817.1 hypothetical protein [Schlegelella koreensis]